MPLHQCRVCLLGWRAGALNTDTSPLLFILNFLNYFIPSIFSDSTFLVNAAAYRVCGVYRCGLVQPIA